MEGQSILKTSTSPGLSILPFMLFGSMIYSASSIELLCLDSLCSGRELTVYKIGFDCPC
ncbi:MAG: hypothetical protein NC932_00350 [Candidatus Omnitrophica bacterium]|nr:hypothetical protein [Candidatus Omnitrophota bacterium]